jgi:hypothetical protein
VRDTHDAILSYYLTYFDVEVECVDKTLTIQECLSEMKKMRVHALKIS